MITQSNLFIGGQWVSPRSDEVITVRSANTEQMIGSVPAAARADVDAAVGAARVAFDDPTGWPQWEAERTSGGFAQAGGCPGQAFRGHGGAGQRSERHADHSGQAVRLSPARSRAALLRGSDLQGADNEEMRPSSSGGTTLVRRVPLGVVAAVVPWNYPNTLAAVKYAPALAAGCTVVLKPSPETVLDSILLAEAVLEAELPAGCDQHRAGRQRAECLSGRTSRRGRRGVHRFRPRRAGRSARCAAGCCGR